MLNEKVLPMLVAWGVTVYEPFREFKDRATRKFWKFDLSNKETTKFWAYSNSEAIKGSKLVLAILDGVDIDSGTASEVWFSVPLWKTVYGIRTDFRCNSSDAAAVRVNLQVEWFIDMSGWMIFGSYAEAIKASIDYIMKLKR